MPHSFPQVCLASASNVGAGTITRLASSVVSSTRANAAVRSPIDRAFESLLVVTQMAVDLDPKWQPQHGMILSSSAVAAAEDYFRSILIDVVEVCELCARRVRPFETRMEFVFSGSIHDALRGLLEFSSLSSKENVIDWARKITGATFKDARSLLVALDEFERICHVRHAAMHSGGHVSTNNARVLEVDAGSWISFKSPTAIHEIISVVAATLRSFNQNLFEAILNGWLNENILSGDWTADSEKFSALWNVFRSSVDIESNRTSGDGTMKTNAYHAYRSIQKAVNARAAAAASI